MVAAVCSKTGRPVEATTTFFLAEKSGLCWAAGFHRSPANVEDEDEVVVVGTAGALSSAGWSILEEEAVVLSPPWPCSIIRWVLGTLFSLLDRERSKEKEKEIKQRKGVLNNKLRNCSGWGGKLIKQSWRAGPRDHWSSITTLAMAIAEDYHHITDHQR